jgi:iron complex outermembrane receptor protein
MQQDAVMISDTKIASPKTESGKSITIITAEELATAPVSSVDEALRYYAGLNVNSRGGFGVQSDVGIRGSTFSQVLWLLDGMRLNDPLTGHFNSYLPITMEEIHHVEVVKGPGALSFGPDAVGGVIHIFSKAYMRDFDSSGPLSLQAAGGSHAYLMGEAAVQGGSKRSHFTISGRHQSSDGQQFSNPNDVTDAPTTYNTDFDISTVSASFQQQFSDSLRLFVRGGFDHRDFGAKFFYTASPFDESREETTSLWGHVSLQKQGVRQSRAFNVSYRRTDDIFTFNPIFTSNEHTTQLAQASYDYGVKFGERVSFASGIQTFVRDIESTDRGDHSNFNLAGYTMVKGAKDAWLYTGGLRFEYFSATGGYQAVPQVTLAYVSDRWKLRTLIGRAYRVPDFTENFVSFNIPQLTAGRNLGNPDLDPEASWTFDLGLDYYISDNLKWETSVFYRTSTSLIDFVLTPAGSISRTDNLILGESYLFATNISAAQTGGLESSLSGGWQLGPKTSFRTHLNLTVLSTTIADDVESKYISNHPTMISNAMLQLQHGKWSLTSTSAYIERDGETIDLIEGQILDSYFLQHLRLGYTLDKFNVYVEGRNIFDTQYQEVLGAPMPGRWLMGGLRYRL